MKSAQKIPAKAMPKLETAKKKSNAPKPPAQVVASSVKAKELHPENQFITVLGVELEMKRNNFGIAGYQGIIEDYFDGNAEGLSTMDNLYALTYAFTRSARNALRRDLSVPRETANKLIKCSFEDWCDLIEDLAPVIEAVNAQFGEEDSGNDDA